MADIQIATSQAELAECLRLRRIVFIEEQQVPEHEEVDGDDDHCTHILARVDGMAMGTARFQYIDNKAKIQRVCIVKEARGIGLGAILMGGVLDVIRSERKVQTAVLGSQTHALTFYEKLGFEAYGDEYLDAGILHQDMKITL